MIAVLAAAAVGLLSAFLPFTPAEPYLIAAVTTTGAPPVALGMAAAAGQTAGKVLDLPRYAWRDPLALAATPAQQPRAGVSEPSGRWGTMLARPTRLAFRLLRYRSHTA